MGALGPRTLDPLSLGSQPSGVTRVTRLVTRCVAPAWDVAQVLLARKPDLQGSFRFFVLSSSLIFVASVFYRAPQSAGR